MELVTLKELALLEQALDNATPGEWREHEDVPLSLVSDVSENESLLGLNVDRMAVFECKADQVAAVMLHNMARRLIAQCRSALEARGKAAGKEAP